MTSASGRAAVLGSLLILLLPAVPDSNAQSVSGAYSHRVAVLDLGAFGTIRGDIARALSAAGLTVVAATLADAAAAGVGYDGSLNPTRDEIRRLASAIGCEIVVLGRASVVERDDADARRRWDGFAGTFVVDGRSGELLRYRGVQVFESDRALAERQVLALVASEVASWPALIGQHELARDDGRQRSDDGDFVDLVSRPEGTPEIIPPRFFSRPVPAYTPDADRIHASASVELVVEFLADGSYGRIDVERWAGLGLDQAAMEAVRASRFWPARMNGKPVPCRAMLRFNFRFRGDEPIALSREPATR